MALALQPTFSAQAAAAKKVALVVRVSTDMQAANTEGSLKNQVQRLRQHITYKREVSGEDWQEVQLYELKAVSGKHSMRRPELAPLFADMRAGRINTILCTALDRSCRNVKDFFGGNVFHFITLIQCLKTKGPL